MITVCFRFDDPSEISDHELEKKIIALFIKHDVPLCIAVVPFKRRAHEDRLWPLSVEGARHMIEGVKLGVVEVAQHGYSHVSRSGSDSRCPSEFSGADYDAQEWEILAGRRHLSDLFNRPIEGFVPPFNAYNRKTLQVLVNHKYEYISAGWDGPLSIEASRSISILPRTCSLGNARAALQEAEKFQRLHPMINVVMHHDDFEEHMYAGHEDFPPCINLDDLECLLRELKVNQRIRLCSLRSLSQQAASNYRHFENMKWMNSVHWKLQPYMPKSIMLTCSRNQLVIEACWQFMKGRYAAFSARASISKRCPLNSSD